ncbi:MAG: ATP-dependent DNA helicase [Candidatus Adiutrix sp.]|jgi:ATP-dependent DNA helicase DinG|nr:ATP-dependent DNA helicase [Candidatus Adiutrix sp.]
MKAELKRLLGPEGPLAAGWNGYEPRRGQLAMALEVARAFLEDDVCLVEAGTGTGKTLAYLLPALMSGKKTVVSTGLKNLQDQIFDKDIPFIRKFFGDNFKAARLKGRENYLCLHYLRQALAQPGLFASEDEERLKLVGRLAPRALYGDRTEFPFLEEGAVLWAAISAPAERCLGLRCPEMGDCFLWQARRAAAGADLVLVNHHLFMADLAVRLSGFGEVLPEWEAAVFDEAHLLEEAATSYFGRSVNSGALLSLKHDLERAIAAAGFSAQARLGPSAALFGRQAEALPLAFHQKPGERELWRDDHPEDGPLRDYLMNFYHDALALAENIKPLAQDDEVFGPLLARLSETASNLLFIAEGQAGASGAAHDYVYQVERQGRRLTLAAYPISVARQLADGLIRTGRSLVFTSATLSSGGDFSYFKERLGLWPEVEGLALESPFDYQGRTLTYLPAHLPPPDDPLFPDALAAEVEALVNISRGRALVLFTSYKNMNHVAARLRGRTRWPLLVQGETGRAVTLERFKDETASVLLATHSFWQGVDVPGESLSAVIIEKLPFPRPDRPLVRARAQLLDDDGRDAFMEYFLPEASLTLKQGLGRLMRSSRDQGLLAVLDVRLSKKVYGKKILRSLPQNRRTSDIAAVAEFMKDV